MADKVAFELVSPERLLYSDDCDMVVVPGAEGDFGVLPRHAPVISTVRPGVIDIHDDGKVERRIFVAGGFAEVTESRCTVLAEEAVPVDDIDTATAETRLSEAKSAFDSAGDDSARSAAERRLRIAEAYLAAGGG
jgi:F-type H+-transporting ATPase subunit epsilon